MQRRRRRRANLFTMATLISSSLSLYAREWTTSHNCLASCSLDVPLCLMSLYDGECLALTQTETAGEWHIALEATQSYTFGFVNLSSEIQTLQLQGDKTRVQFDTSSVWMGERLIALLFIGLNLSNTTLPKLPNSLTQMHMTDCVFDKLPLTWIQSLPLLETLVMMDNNLTDATQTLMELSNQQYKLLSSRVRGDVVLESQVEEAQIAACTKDRGGSVQRLGRWPVCVTPDDALLARRLLLYANTGSNESFSASSSGSASAHDHDTPPLVMLSLGLPFIFCLYKMGLFFYFMRTHNRYSSKSGGATGGAEQVDNIKDVAIAMTRDSDANRPTTNDSSTSPPSSPFPRVYQNQEKQPSSTNIGKFWVDEELQPWRLDFQRLKLLKCLNLLPTQKRQTLRKQSVTSAMNLREIWLASLDREEVSTAALSSGGGATTTLVVAKFLAPKEEFSSAIGNAKDKLKRELKRQATFSHPQVATFIGVAWSRDTHLLAITEYMAQGDLRQWLHRTASTQSGQWSVVKVQMLLDVSKALLYLHSMHRHLVHGNCNSRNVLLDQSLRAKLSDFGADSPDSLTEQELMAYSAVGSGRWISPEALLGCEASASYPDASDVYSFGILIAEMDSHELPFSDLMQANRSAVPETDILQLIARGALSPTLSPTCPTSVVELVNACTSYKPKDRPSSTQVQEDLLRILEDFQEFESKTTATILTGAPRVSPPSNLV